MLKMLKKCFAVIVPLAIPYLVTTGCPPEPVKIHDFTLSVQQISNVGFVTLRFSN
jgi:hypothetical protein